MRERGGIALRSPHFALALVSVALAAPLALADVQATFTDAAGDESLLFGPTALNGAAPADCKAPAIDLLRLDVAADDATLVLRLAAADLDRSGAECAGAPFETPFASWSARLTAPAPPDEPIALYSPIEVTAGAHRVGFGLDGCIRMYFAEAHTPACVGSVVRDGDALVWTLPVHGVVEVLAYDDLVLGVLAHEEERGYDLRGLAVDAHAGALASLTTFATPAGTIRDSVAGGRVTL